MVGKFVSGTENQAPNYYQKKTVETYSDRELKNKLCGAGCANCEVLDMCRIGQEWMRRESFKKEKVGIRQ